MCPRALWFSFQEILHRFGSDLRPRFSFTFLKTPMPKSLMVKNVVPFFTQLSFNKIRLRVFNGIVQHFAECID